ncbi:hypothetical protein [Cohnella herbarum]|uniref:Uncharacterized protein n=1 Tax=Cohnella herbarum TaxID=2728023 RepID=A0A7Z2ZK16_9BACL|nr:hypothetical protein [Cohnella herbarum]QJD82463.1 hypothetical protein HH215_04190 [Cohnella herbarum]
MDDKDLFEQLKRGPLTRNGFDDNLRRRINDNLDKPSRRTIRPWYTRMGAISAAFVLLVAVVGLLNWKSLSGDSSQKLTLPTDQASASAQASKDRDINPVPHSAVVIGLRTDEAQGTSSEYRTIFVAPENNELSFVKSGSGIWMPYKSNFWKIDAVPDSMGNGTQLLVALKSGVEKKVNQPFVAKPMSQSEKLLYAGNEFVSIMQTTNLKDKGNTVDRSEVWVNQVTNLAPAVRYENNNALAEGNFTLARALGTNESELQIDQWAIAREPGSWVAKQPGSTSLLTNETEIASWPNVSVQLSKAIVKDDPLALTWDEVKSLESQAVDAFTSQDEDIAIIVTDNELKLIPYQLPQTERTEKTVTLSLKPNESIVMVQWATQEKYVENWKLLFSKWFATSAE